MQKLEEIYVLLENLPVPYGSAPFWGWNDKLDKAELVRQIREMKEQHMGGFFIHSREGLETEYLSEEWMDCVEAAIAEARVQGMDAWIYDEDKWPSGSAGGKVSAADPQEYTAKGLTAELLSLTHAEAAEELLSPLREEESLFRVYRIAFSPSGGDQIASFEAFTVHEPLEGEAFPLHVLVCRMETSGTSEWYNGLAPTDNLNPQGVQCFLELTHEAYKARFGSDFGSTVKGFFTDEPNFCDFFSHFTPGRPWLPWSVVLEEFFLSRRGYPIDRILPLLFFHGPGEEKGRYDYWLTLTELFVSSYTKQLYDWCEENDLHLTGHMLYENDLGYSVRVSGASMPHYRYMHAPGIDLLGDQRQEFLTVKQCTSVANQFGKETVLSETYGCTGWDFSFAGQKRVGDWQFVMGVNKRCQHLALYSFSGCRKRDYPPSFNYHNGWWPYHFLLEDYFARLSVCVSQGQVYRNILLIHPMGSFWMKSGSALEEDLNRCQMNMGWLDDHILDRNKEGDSYNQLTRLLLMAQFDFDFGDELIMREEAHAAEGILTIGLQGYGTVIVPPVETLMGSTVTLLEEFLASGGSLYWVKPFPERVDAVTTDRLEKLQGHPRSLPVEDYGDLLAELSRKEKRPLRICDAFGRDTEGFLSMVREGEDGWIYTVVNTDSAKEQEVVLHFSEQGQLRSYDLLTGAFAAEKVCPGSGTTSSAMRLPVRFAPEDTRVFFLEKETVPVFSAFLPRYTHPHAVESVVMTFPPETAVSLSMENALTLDRCRFRFKGEPWQEETLLWQGQKSLREKLGMPPVYYNGAPQRYSWIRNEGASAVLPLEMEFVFYADAIPSDPVYLAMEKSRDFSIRCNDRPCAVTDQFYLDRSLLKHRIPSLIPGKNTLRIAVPYHQAIELEDLYLVGNFGVSPERRIVAPPKSLHKGDWTLQGLYHYPGSVCYHYSLPPLSPAEDRTLQLKLGIFSGTLAVVRINGGEPLYALRGNSLLGVTGQFYRDKENQVDIEIVGNLRNLMGPFHRSYSPCSRISWEDFRTEGLLFSPEYSVQPIGLWGEVAVLAGE